MHHTGDKGQRLKNNLCYIRSTESRMGLLKGKQEGGLAPVTAYLSKRVGQQMGRTRGCSHGRKKDIRG